jgi:hypothetical protein
MFRSCLINGRHTRLSFKQYQYTVNAYACATGLQNPAHVLRRVYSLAADLPFFAAMS